MTVDGAKWLKGHKRACRGAADLHERWTCPGRSGFPIHEVGIEPQLAWVHRALQHRAARTADHDATLIATSDAARAASIVKRQAVVPYRAPEARPAGVEMRFDPPVWLLGIVPAHAISVALNNEPGVPQESGVALWSRMLVGKLVRSVFSPVAPEDDIHAKQDCVRLVDLAYYRLDVLLRIVPARHEHCRRWLLCW